VSEELQVGKGLWGVRRVAGWKRIFIRPPKLSTVDHLHRRLETQPYYEVNLEGPIQEDIVATSLRFARSLFDHEGPGSKPGPQHRVAVDLQPPLGSSARFPMPSQLG
jgi:hypothetical protein